jgi:casein kinase II subunit alpha
MTLVLCKRSDGSDFLITKRLGSGSYGEAYLGHNTTSNTPYVFKLYRFGKLQRKKMMREILVTQSVCGHPNIIKLQHVIKQTLTDYPILVFEYVKDTYYRDLYPKLTPEDVRFYMYKLFDAMAFAHERGVMHKDLKPANVMIDHDTHTLKVIDWGLSQFYVKGKVIFKCIICWTCDIKLVEARCRLQRSCLHCAADESQSIAGSMYYKSPEMLMDYGKSELSTDIWSMGCMFAAMLYQTDIFFVGDDEFDQVLTIAKVGL